MHNPVDTPNPNPITWAQRHRKSTQWISLLAVGVYGCAIEWLFGWQHIVSSWSQLPFWQPATALIVLLFTYGIRGLRIYDYFFPLTKGRLRTCCKIMLTHNLLNNLLPMRTGEASFPLLMRQYFEMPIASATSGLLLLRLLDLQVLLCIGCLSLLGYAAPNPWLWLSLPPIIIAPLFLLTLKPWLTRRAEQTNKAKLKRMLLQIISALPHDLFHLIRTWSLTWLCWGSKIMAFSIVMQWFAQTDWWSVMGACIGGELSSVLPIHSPGGLGTYEMSMLGAARILGIEGDWVLFAGVQLHLFIIFSTLLGGLVAIFLSDAPRKSSI